MKIITWNVAGFRRANSLDTWDYSEVDIKYFVDIISDLNPDIVHFQEVEFVEGVDRVKEISEILRFENYQGIPMHPNHIGEGELGYAILSKDTISNLNIIDQPYPTFELTFSDGKEAVRYDKKFVSYTSFGLNLTTLQLQPLHYWGYSYYEEPGYSYGKEISNNLLSLKSDIITGDFQISHLIVPLENLFTSYNDILPNKFTRMRKNGKHTKSDHILAKEIIKVESSEVIKTKTDHYLCYADLTTL
jgi:hypothetical protein